MKNYFLFFSTLFFLVYSAKAQDTIHKRNGDIIISKISELTSTEIKYKRFDFQDGPMYVELKSNVASIHYSNGLKETFKEESVKINEPAAPVDYYGGNVPINNKISLRGRMFYYKNQYYTEREIQEVLLDTRNKTIMGYVTKARQAKGMQYIGFAAIPLGVVGLIALGSSSTTNNYNNTTRTDNGLVALGGICIAAAIACPISSGIFKHNRKEYNRKAIKLYNDTY